jgi:hypothetical protein
MLRTDIIYYYKHDREILIKYYETWTKSYAMFYVSKTNKMTPKNGELIRKVNVTATERFL